MVFGIEQGPQKIGLINFLWNCFFTVCEPEYMNMPPPPSSITDLPQSLLNHSLSIIIIITGKNVRLLLNMLNVLGFIKND